MSAIGWILRILVILFIIRLVLRFLYRIAGAASPPRSTRNSNHPSTREGGQLVRDPNCGTYVAVGRALREGSGDSAIYFCSEACRTAWASRKTS